MKMRLGGVKSYCVKGRRYSYDRRTHTRIIAARGTAEFAAELAALRQQPQPNLPAAATLGAILLAFQASDEFKALDRTIQSGHRKLLNWVQPFHSVATEKIDATFVQALRQRARNARGQAFAKRVMATLKAVLAWAVSHGHLTTNPLGIEIKKPKRSPGKRDV